MQSNSTHAPLDELRQRLAALHAAASDLHRDVNEIKLRLFNGVTDTMRETYAKVLILEKKQESYEGFMQQYQGEWEKVRDLRQRRDSRALILIWCASLLNFSAAALSYAASGGFRDLF